MTTRIGENERAGSPVSCWASNLEVLSYDQVANACVCQRELGNAQRRTFLEFVLRWYVFRCDHL